MKPNRKSLRTEWLGRWLRSLRDESGRRIADVAGALERDPSSISRLETGTGSLPRRDIETILDYLEVDHADSRAQAVLTLSQEGDNPGWWEAYVDVVDPSMLDHTWLESRTAAIESFQALWIDGLLQTRPYAEWLVRSYWPSYSDRDVDKVVDLRMMRQTILDRSTHTRLSVILDEAVLHRWAGSSEDFEAQLRHLMARGQQPHISIQVLRLTDTRVGSEGHFSIMRLDDPLPTVPCVESAAGTLFLDPDQVPQFQDTWERLVQQALTPEDSLDLIARVADGKENL